MDPVTPLVEMQGITKRFPAVVANDRIDLHIYAGENLALLGENSAGKTTLMKVLYGIYQPDARTIYIDGKRTILRTPLPYEADRAWNLCPIHRVIRMNTP
jgi:general nucleoside transport system ATP-binding protein